MKAAAVVAVPKGKAMGTAGVVGAGTGCQMGEQSIYLLTEGDLVAHFHCSPMVHPLGITGLALGWPCRDGERIGSFQSLALLHNLIKG